MNPEQKVCKKCSKDFFITSDDILYYEKIGVCHPDLCSDCRAQLRLSFRNERVFYKRACDKCKKDTVSMYSPNKQFTVYCYECWYGDEWDAIDFAQEYDDQRPFLDQFEELVQKVPRVGLVYVRSPGSDYTNISADNKNCYMIVESSNNEDAIHSYWIQECRDVVDTSFASKCELTYESDDCYNSYKLLYSKGCHDCSTSYFLTDCRGCTDCIGCVNLRQKSNYIFNQPYSKEEYEEIKSQLELTTRTGVEACREKYLEFLLSQPRKFAEQTQVVNSSGTYMKSTKNCISCFHCYDSEDNKYGVHIWRNAKDTMDCDTAGRNASLIYNSINTGIDDASITVGALCWTCTFVEYCMNCFNSNHCFGSVGLRKKNYVLLNKQYSKEEYEELMEKIRKELYTEGKYGQFFPQSFSSFGYNESAAFDQFPLSKEEATIQGFKWEDTPRGTYGRETIQKNQMPESSNDLSFDATKEIFSCNECSKNYKIIPNELLFYTKLNIPLPDMCPDCRHLRRFKNRGPNKLWKRKCMNIGCTNEFETNYSPEKSETVYCENCYQQLVN